MDSSGKGRRTPVHSCSCAVVGKSDFSSFSTEPGECGLRYAHDSLRTKYVPELALVCERDLGMTTVWNKASRTGNPSRSDLVSKYMALTREEQRKAGVLGKTSTGLLQSHLSTMIAHLKTQLQTSRDQTKRFTLARNIAVLTVAFSTVLQNGGMSLLAR